MSNATSGFGFVSFCVSLENAVLILCISQRNCKPLGRDERKALNDKVRANGN